MVFFGTRRTTKLAAAAAAAMPSLQYSCQHYQMSMPSRDQSLMECMNSLSSMDVLLRRPNADASDASGHDREGSTKKKQAMRIQDDVDGPWMMPCFPLGTIDNGRSPR